MTEAPDSALRAGPWCWPRSDARCDKLAQRLGPMPRPSRGSLPVVSVSEDDETVVAWCIAPTPHATSHNHAIGTTLGPQMRQSWRAATVALPRALPVLWRNVRDATRLLPEITPLHGLRTTPGFVDPGVLVEGPSFGLAFCLHLASVVLGCPVPPQVVAAAAIDPSGSVLPVGGARAQDRGDRDAAAARHGRARFGRSGGRGSSRRARRTVRGRRRPCRRRHRACVRQCADATARGSRERPRAARGTHRQLLQACPCRQRRDGRLGAGRSGGQPSRSSIGRI